MIRDCTGIDHVTGTYEYICPYKYSVQARRSRHKQYTAVLRCSNPQCNYRMRTKRNPTQTTGRQAASGKRQTANTKHKQQAANRQSTKNEKRRDFLDFEV